MKIEFIDFKDNIQVNGSTEVVKVDGVYMSYNEFEKDPNRLRIVYFFLLDRPECRAMFNKMKEDGIIGYKDQIRQFKRCNLDSLDNKIDIDTDLNYFNPEYVNNCGHKGANRHCPHAKTEGDRKPYCIIKNKYQIPVK